ncbi:RWD repeat domain-containing protein [Microdochium trichocladiopsis]|uniref:RWD repeat domain-containing protein n=1 Tax=Microdochium trichocladiopsis TaxID=1682393 RepID=A0A9P9BR60_9PEZI|nr:RWD repeat domain-containing protein [Microdochium trichocladiopsis]KAH7031607.1 RWD repeat domain-containing protein [Microdochium trichocladiopsis]
MGKEEQVEEREVLDSIFPDEITDVSETEYRISIVLDLPDNLLDPPVEPPTMLLHVRYPDDYPDVAPHLDLSPPQNNTSPHPFFSVAGDKEQLLEGLQATVDENLGMAMVFTLVSAVKEAAEQLVLDRKEAAVRVQEEKAAEAEREENKKFQGTPVNPETFMKWREDFLREMEEVRIREEDERLAELKKARVKEPVKLTGKQIWERGLAGKGDEGDEDDVPGLEEGVDKLKVAA